MDSKRYVPLLPSARNLVTPDPGPTAAGNQTRKRKRVATQLACNLCRSKKTRCDGTRPSCNLCVKRSEKCVYNDKRDAAQDSIDMVELLIEAPYAEALDALRLLRSTGDESVVLSVIKGGGGDSNNGGSNSNSNRNSDGNGNGNGDSSSSSERNSMAPPQQPSTRAFVPQRSSLELELMTKNSITYAPLRNISMSELEESNLLRPISAARDSKRPNEPRWSGEMMFSWPGRSTEDAQIDNDSAAASFRAQQSPTNRSPRWNDGLCDARLKSLRIRHWTHVPIPDEAAARVVSMYLETDHPLLGMFDPDRFICDLVGQHQKSCSALVVNALLYWGCQMYTAIDKSVAQYTEQFCVEAERLWAAAKDLDCLLNMIGAQLLSLAFVGQGKDHKVTHFLGVAIQMGTRLGLFGVTEEEAKVRTEAIPESSQAAISNTAWGVFNWSIIVSLFYQQPGVKVPRLPPTTPIPRVDMAEDNQEVSSGGATSSKKPSQVQAIMGVTFPRVCELWALMHQVSLLYRQSKDTMQPDRLSLGFAEMKYRELLAWAENLPSELHRSDSNPHHAVILHMWFHAAILDLFRPFLRRDGAETRRLRTFSAANRTPVAAYVASVNQLKHLIVHFRSSYEASTCTLLWQTAMMYVANAVLRDSHDPEWHQYLLLCLYGYETLWRPFRVAEAIGRGLLTMMLRDKDGITSAQAHEILRHLKERGINYISDEIRAPFMGDLELAQTDPAGATMEKLAGDFEDMALFQEFTNRGRETPQNG
ncbi:hypothetical protein PG985_013025 [Apiospora marii]|uniref:Zn(2)-C6 fungal-type domain-containing protein n=1 Tax=Apiospora marii TaxID=335849 RepID=A0ABR1R8W1_9PEZI